MGKRIDKKVNFKIYDVTIWNAENYSKYIFEVIEIQKK